MGRNRFPLCLCYLWWFGLSGFCMHGNCIGGTGREKVGGPCRLETTLAQMWQGVLNACGWWICIAVFFFFSNCCDSAFYQYRNVINSFGWVNQILNRDVVVHRGVMVLNSSVWNLLWCHRKETVGRHLIGAEYRQQKKMCLRLKTHFANYFKVLSKFRVGFFLWFIDLENVKANWVFPHFKVE